MVGYPRLSVMVVLIQYFLFIHNLQGLFTIVYLYYIKIYKDIEINILKWPQILYFLCVKT